jgi:hypothetical protein
MKIVDFIFVFEIVKFIINLGFTKSINVFKMQYFYYIFHICI